MSTVAFLEIDHLFKDCGPVEVSSSTSSTSSPDATSRGLMSGAVEG